MEHRQVVYSFPSLRVHIDTKYKPLAFCPLSLITMKQARAICHSRLWGIIHRPRPWLNIGHDQCIEDTIGFWALSLPLLGKCHLIKQKWPSSTRLLLQFLGRFRASPSSLPTVHILWMSCVYRHLPFIEMKFLTWGRQEGPSLELMAATMLPQVPILDPCPRSARIKHIFKPFSDSVIGQQ